MFRGFSGLNLEALPGALVFSLCCPYAVVASFCRLCAHSLFAIPAIVLFVVFPASVCFVAPVPFFLVRCSGCQRRSSRKGIEDLGTSAALRNVIIGQGIC